MVTLKDKVKDVEMEEINSALKECNFVRARAARRLGITERMICYKIKIYGIRVKEVGSIEDSAAEQQDTRNILHNLC